MLGLLTTTALAIASSRPVIGGPSLSTDTTGPTRRAHHAMGYDASRQRVLLTGGSTPLDGGQRGAFFNDLWTFDGTGWSPLPSSGSPSSGRRLAFDPEGQRMVSFGGYDGKSLGEVRVLEGDTWRTIGSHPTMIAAEAGFVFDRALHRFIAFGGSAGPGETNGETWMFDGSAWIRFDGASPPGRQAHAMEYDERRQRVVVFGGMGHAPRGQRPPPRGDLWEFDGARWTEVPASGEWPSPRSSPGSAYDSKRNWIILFGGIGESGFLGDTWAWDGRGWRKLADTGPQPRAMGYLAYDRVRDRVVLFGGRKGWPDGDLDDTWEWDGTRWSQIGVP